MEFIFFMNESFVRLLLLHILEPCKLCNQYFDDPYSDNGLMKC